jgi:hypothetical protein
VIPVFIKGQNSLFFQYLGLALEPLQLALTVREMLMKKGTIDFTIGKSISYTHRIADMNPIELTEHLRHELYALKYQLP